jgi:nicotinic acid mononucleotide adenylyltransferase
LGHFHVIEQIFKNTDIDKLIIVPDGLRLDKDYNIDEIHRKELISIFIEELNNI